MSRESSPKSELVAELAGMMRELSTATILFHQAVADRLGMNVTDHKCAGILTQSGPITAGDLAVRTGLTTGAVTGVIDRLEKAGFVRRVRDGTDRRRVIVEPDCDAIAGKSGPCSTRWAVKPSGSTRDTASRSLRLFVISQSSRYGSRSKRLAGCAKVPKRRRNELNGLA